MPLRAATGDEPVVSLAPHVSIIGLRLTIRVAAVLFRPTGAFLGAVSESRLAVDRYSIEQVAEFRYRVIAAACGRAATWSVVRAGASSQNGASLGLSTRSTPTAKDWAVCPSTLSAA